MNRFQLTALLIGIASALGGLAPSAAAQSNDFPPPEVIATLAPVYFEGHAAYWYHSRWYYRDARGVWGTYHDEPAFHARPLERHYYTTGHPAGHDGRGHR